MQTLGRDSDGNGLFERSMVNEIFEQKRVLVFSSETLGRGVFFETGSRNMRLVAVPPAGFWGDFTYMELHIYPKIREAQLTFWQWFRYIGELTLVVCMCKLFNG